METLMKQVDGVLVPMKPEEEVEVRASWAAAAEQAERSAAPTSQEVAAARAALDALVAAGVISAEARAQMSPAPM